MARPGTECTALSHAVAAPAAGTPTARAANAATSPSLNRIPLVRRRRRVGAGVLATHGTRGAEHAAPLVESLHLHDRARAADGLSGLESSALHAPRDDLQLVAGGP